MKTATHENWHAWDTQNPFQSTIALSDESEKKMRQFLSWDDCINWLYVNGHRDAARSINKQVKA